MDNYFETFERYNDLKMSSIQSILIHRYLYNCIIYKNGSSTINTRYDITSILSFCTTNFKIVLLFI